MPSAASTPRDQRSWVAVALVAVSVIAWFATFGAKQQLEAVDITAAVVAVAGVVGAYAILVGRAGLTPTRLTIAWSAFLAWAFVSMLASGRGWTAFMGEATALTGWAALAAVTLTAWSAGHLHSQVGAAVRSVAPWLVAFQSGFAVIQLLLGGFGVGTLPNSTYLGEAVLLLLPFVLEPADKRVGRDLWTRVGIVLLAVVALGASASRVAAVLGLIWTVWCFSRQTAAPAAVRRWAGPVAILLVAAGGMVFARSEILGSVGVGTLGGRPSMWRLAILGTEARPLLGWGPDGFVAGGAAVMTPQLAERGFNLVFRFGTTDPHNLFMFIAVSFGVVGLALFVWSGVETLLRWRAQSRHGTFCSAAAWALALCLGVLLTAPPSPHILPLLGIVAGLSVAPLAQAGGRVALQRYVAVAAAAGLAIACALWGASALTRLPFEDSGPEVSPPKAAGSLRASRVWTFDPHLAYLTSLHYGYAARVDPGIAATQPDLAAVARAAALDRRSPFYALEWARTLGFYGSDPELVANAYEETLRRYPGYPAARAEYALFLAQQGNVDEAQRQLAIARLVDDGDPQVTSAIEAVEQALGR